MSFHFSCWVPQRRTYLISKPILTHMFICPSYTITGRQQHIFANLVWAPRNSHHDGLWQFCIKWLLTVVNWKSFFSRDYSAYARSPKIVQKEPLGITCARFTAGWTPFLKQQNCKDKEKHVTMKLMNERDISSHVTHIITLHCSSNTARTSERLSLMKISWSQWPLTVANVSSPSRILPEMQLLASPLPKNGYNRQINQNTFYHFWTKTKCVLTVLLFQLRSS